MSPTFPSAFSLGLGCAQLKEITKIEINNSLNFLMIIILIVK
jgi:hypothetical protein